MILFLGTLLAFVIRYFLYFVEAAVGHSAGAGARCCVRIRERRNGGADSVGFTWLARRRKLAVIVPVGILPIAIRVALLPILPPLSACGSPTISATYWRGIRMPFGG